ncbi:MAG: DIP1984 family protein [Candidatus Delongbacteria bacterium]|jgi:hypothetical protein|nr:DIP1984 family protein [Candidatus Delongbacteria bacterium]
MKLAEALITKKDLEIEVANLHSMLLETSKVQEGGVPFQKPELLLNTIKNKLEELETLTIKIHKTNSATVISSSVTLTDVITQRDMIKKRHKLYSTVYKEICTRGSYSRSDVKYTVAIDVNALLNHISEAAKQYRVLDTQIQATNWATELI